MNDYSISKAYHWTDDNELEISSKDLLYVEAGGGSGMQCNSVKNYDKINEKCKKIADLIREIDQLNKVKL